MCFTCDYDPFELIRSTRELLAKKAASEHEMDKAEATLLKDSLRILELATDVTCDDGAQIKDSIKNRQYELSKKL